MLALLDDPLKLLGHPSDRVIIAVTAVAVGWLDICTSGGSGWW